MLKLPVAIQLYSVRDDAGRDFEGTLKKIKDFGYDGVEFAGLYGKSYKEVKDLCDSIGLVPVSAHVPFAELIANPDSVVAGYKSIGCPQITIPYLPEEYRPGQEKYDEFVDGVKRIAEACKNNGVVLAYHNHDFEFEKVNGQYLFDKLYSDLPEDILKVQIDTCWVNVGGENPAEYIRKYSDRQPTLHLKDFKGKRGEKMYALIGIDDTDQKDQQYSGEFSLMPVGYGVQDFEQILSAAQDANVKWLIVEQDSPSMGKTPMECAQLSINYLKSL